MCLCGLALVRHGVETRQGLNLILRDLLFAIALYQLQLTCGDQFVTYHFQVEYQLS